MPSSGAPPLVVCGTTLSTAANGPYLMKVWWRHVHGSGLSAGNRYYLRVSRGCAHGSRVSIDPEGAAVIVRRARAEDGLPAAVVLRAERPVLATITARQGGQIVGSLHLRLQVDGASPTATASSPTGRAGRPGS